MAIVGALGASSLAHSSEAHETATRTWSVGMYLNADNNLEQAIARDLREVLRGLAREKNDDLISVAVELHSSLLRRDQDYSGFPTIRLIATDPAATSERSALLRWNEHRNMALPSHLTDFIDWMTRERPSVRRALIVSSHGSGARGEPSTTPTQPHMSVGVAPASIEEAKVGASSASRSLLYDHQGLPGHMLVEQFADALRQSTRAKLDLVGLDACLMSTLEVAYAMRDSTTWLVASEMLEPDEGWDHAVWANRLARSPSQTTETLALSFLDAYETSLSRTTGDGKNRDRTLAIVRTNRASNVASRLDKLVEGLVGWGSTPGQTEDFRRTMKAARNACTSFGEPTITANTVDLWCWLDGLRPRIPTDKKDLRDSLVSVQDEICKDRKVVPADNSDGLENGRRVTCAEGLILEASIGSQLPTTFSGVSIFFPQTPRDSIRGVTLSAYSQTGEHGLAFIKEHPQWLTFLNMYLSL